MRTSRSAANLREAVRRTKIGHGIHGDVTGRLPHLADDWKEASSHGYRCALRTTSLPFVYYLHAWMVAHLHATILQSVEGQILKYVQAYATQPAFVSLQTRHCNLKRLVKGTQPFNKHMHTRMHTCHLRQQITEQNPPLVPQPACACCVHLLHQRHSGTGIRATAGTVHRGGTMTPP